MKLIANLQRSGSKVRYTICILFVSVLILSTESCSNLNPEIVMEESVQEIQYSLIDQVQLVDDRLYIPDYTTFNELMDFYIKNQNRRIYWESWILPFEQKGFECIRNAYDHLDEEDFQKILAPAGLEEYQNILTLLRGDDGEMEATIQVPHPFLSKIVNRKGLLQIGNTVIKYSYNYSLSVENPTIEQIGILENLKENEIPAFAVKSEIIRNGDSDFSAARTSCGGNTNHKVEYASSPNRRINATLIYECTSLGGPNYASIFYSEVKNQRKNTGIWWARDADTIRTEITGSSNLENNWSFGPWDSGYDEYFDTETNCINFLFGTFTSDACYPYINTVTYDFDGSHYVRDQDGTSTGTCINDRHCL